MLLRFDRVTRSFGALTVLDEVSFQINPGEKVGLIGPNGCGKTTLLSLVEFPGEADGGRVERLSGLSTGRIDQHHRFRAPTVLEEARSAFRALEDAEHGLAELEARMQADHSPELMERYAARQTAFENSGGYTYRARTEAALFGLGFRREQFSQPPETLSGGEKNRLALARLLLSEVDLLLLDEPTNHLDMPSIAWLERFVAETDRAVLVVSHDRFFLDRTVGRILELENGRIAEYRGNYTDYLAERQKRREIHEKAWRAQRQEIERTEEFIRRNLAGQKTRQAQSRRKALARMERIERPASLTPGARFQFQETARSPKSVLAARGLEVGHRGGGRVLGDVSFEIVRGQRWAIVGANGTGKTTLLGTLAGRNRPLGGELERGEIDFAWYDQELADLDLSSTVLGELRRLDSRATDGDLRSFLARFLFTGESVDRRVGDLSGGERSRLALACLIHRRAPLLFLDEPTNHLDIASRESLEQALADYPGTLVLVSHDRRLVERVATDIVFLEDGRAEVFDSFERFAAHIEEGERARRSTASPPRPPRRPEGLSKNRKEQLEGRARELEGDIANAERELHALEAQFAAPPENFVWDRAQQRHKELTELREGLYEELEGVLGLSS
jgi:ATP-binding cassette subfamily F protein 3